jgi:hypothetical protein
LGLIVGFTFQTHDSVFGAHFRHGADVAMKPEGGFHCFGYLQLKATYLLNFQPGTTDGTKVIVPILVRIRHFQPCCVFTAKACPDNGFKCLARPAGQARQQKRV